MLAVHDPKDYSNVVPLMLEDDSWHVTHAYNGFDTLTFEVPVDSEYRKLIQEEVKVEHIGSRAVDNRFIIKSVDEHSDFVTVDCDIDLDDWKSKVFYHARWTNSTLDNVLTDILPSGWSKRGVEKFTKRTTVEGNEGEPMEAVGPLDVLDECSEVYGAVFNFDVPNKVIECIDTTKFTPSGEFISEELNLKSLGFVGSTSGYATRLYAYGKEDEHGNPLTFASINGGKEYVEDLSYTDKVICVGWADERYTVKEDLLAAAKKKLEQVSKPVRSYECEVSHLDGNVWMYKVVTLADIRRGIRVDHQVVEWKEFADKSKDSVTLSAMPPSIESLVTDALSKEEVDISGSINNAMDKLTDAYQEAIKNATDKITGSYGGYFKWVYDAEGNPMELVNTADSENLNSARKVWRWNKEGLGHSNNGYGGPYELGLLADGSINANMLTVGVIRGGGSYWNLNTGEMSIIGRFRSGTKNDFIDIDPDFTQNEISGDDVMNGAGIKFSSTRGAPSGREREHYAYIASETSSAEEGNISSIVINGGRPEANDPGSFLRVGMRKDDNGGGKVARVLAIADSVYDWVSAGTDRKFCQLAMKSSNSTASGSTMFNLSARSKNRSVGVEGNVDNGYLYLGGLLGGFTDAATFQTGRWTGSLTTSASKYVTFNLTVTNPAKFGIYRFICAPDIKPPPGKYTMHSESAYNQGASGATGILSTAADHVITKVDSNWNQNASTGVVSNLRISTTYADLWGAGTLAYYFFMIGWLADG